ncbi:MAG: polyprenyl synthetase family protein [Clostridioides sp.]|nr:polyprenyl synthetase family protein [Clostridioides sp.]
MDFKVELKKKASYIEGVLKEYMPEEVGYQQTVLKAMNYSLGAGGKRLRPILVLETCKLVGGDEEEAISFAVAIEMIHTYSLIHDDLPALDNDDLRRGRATSHVVFGEAMAILAGDALLNYAFDIMLKGSIGRENPEKYLKAIYAISKNAGIYGMIGGQVVDVESENKKIDKDKLDYIHKNKTAAMMVGCMSAGALVGGADEEQLSCIVEYAEKIGLAFQIVDDILDIVGDQEKLGKNIGSDIYNNKSTYPSLLGLEKSREIAKELIVDAKKCLDGKFENKEFLDGLADYIISRDH